jgi:DNA repair protein RadC
MSIKNWPELERPREKLLRFGAQQLSDAELLAIFLRTGSKGKTAIDLARQLLIQFNSLNNLFAAKLDEFCQGNGLGVAKYTQLQAALELSRRHLFENIIATESLTNTEQTKQYLQSKLSGRKQEVFAGIFLNSKNRVIAFEELFHGTINRSNIYPREIITAAINHNASAIIFAHNHPSGDPTPSQEDVALTEHLRKILALLDIKVLDHIVVGKSKSVSII